MRSERGGALIEIMMGALLVALAATAVFKGIDGANAVSAGSKSRAIAAAIAQDDQERLRATTPATLVDLDNTKAVTRSGVEYTVRSTARWVADRDAVPNCSATTSRAGYLRITSKVTWPDMRGSKPIIATSLLAPPNGTVTSNRGAIGVKVLDHQNPPQPVPGVSVNVTGPGLSGTTDANGCVFWDDVIAGNYSYTASKGGYVDYHGDTAITRPIGVAGGQTRTDTIYLAPPTGMTVAVRTKWFDGVERAANVTGDKVFLSNSKMTNFNGVRSWTLATADATLTQLFPMQYGVYAGPCGFENNPANNGLTTGVFDPPFTGTKTVYEPMLKVRARYNGLTTGLNGASVRIVQRSQPSGGCSKDYGTFTTANVNDGNSGTSNDDGRIPDGTGFPYGQYRVCAEGRVSGTWRYQIVDATLNNASGVDVDVNMTRTDNNSGLGYGRCPATL